MEVFMDDFSFYGRRTIEDCLENLDKGLTKIRGRALSPKLEKKYHFVVREGIVLGRRVSKWEIEVDRDKVEVIE